jgi:LPXTG-motif cell wall-anchored protein
MSRVFPLRASVATGLTLGVATLGLAVAPAAFAVAPLPAPTVASSTVAPGADFTLSGVGCAPQQDGTPGVAVITPAVDPQWGDATDAGTNGSWTLTESAPTDPGTYEFALFCDRYTERLSYPNVTITVTADGKPVAAPTATPTATPTGTLRGASANTPGVAAKSSAGTTGAAAALGQKLVKVLTGFQPFEVVTLTLHSTPRTVGTFTADAHGVVTASFVLPAGTPVGSHDLVFEGNMGTYFQQPIRVAAAGPELAYTGSDVGMPLALGVGLLLAGTGALVVSRRRSSGAAQA